MNVYKSLVFAHAIVGTVALTSFWLTALSKKGSPLHKRIGKIYLLAMCGILLSGFPMSVLAMMYFSIVQGLFLFYLLLITANAMWWSWRAIKDKQNPARYFGTHHRISAVLMFSSGLATHSLGWYMQAPLLIGFSLIGIIVGIQQWRKSGTTPKDPKWWMREHISGMSGNAIATHIAFINIGLPKVLPMIPIDFLQYFGWFGTPIIAAIIVFYVNRKFLGKPTTRPQSAQT